jgi:hypothetical protein
MTALDVEVGEEECEACGGPATWTCEYCHTSLCGECICPNCDVGEEEPCDRCEKYTVDLHHCDKCWREVCYDCYVLEKGLCADCASVKGERR